MNLTDLVPPLDLCKKIPAGEFGDSALYWGLLDEYLEDVMPRECGYCPSFRCGPKTEIICPAPTLQEILEDFLKNLDSVYVKWSEIAYHGWFVDVCNDRKSWRRDDRNLVVAAMQTWLNMKGINYPGEMENWIFRGEK